MIFKCKNCGGNMVYSPEHNKMLCPFCDSLDSEEKGGNESITVCASCGGELSIKDITSADRCPYCNNYIIFDERVTGKYKPDSIIPFKVSKKQAVEFMESEFKKRFFAPVSFLSEKTLESMSGLYVPFFLYDYVADSEYRGRGIKIRTWSSGDYDYKETSHYEVIRKLHTEYDNIPADASIAMDDTTMDLLEPFDYTKLCEFDPKYMSGFFGEVYNDEPAAFAVRAKNKAISSTKSLMSESMKDYTTLTPEVNETNLSDGKIDYTLFPVWRYVYDYGNKTYTFFVNGQSGKVIGKTPISKLKVFLYALCSGGILLATIEMILKMVEVLING